MQPQATLLYLLLFSAGILLFMALLLRAKVKQMRNEQGKSRKRFNEESFKTQLNSMGVKQLQSLKSYFDKK